MANDWYSDPSQQDAYFRYIGVDPNAVDNSITQSRQIPQGDPRKIREFWDSQRAQDAVLQPPMTTLPTFNHPMTMGDWRSPQTGTTYYRNDFDGQLIRSPLPVGVAGPEAPRISNADSQADLDRHRAMWAQQDAQQMPNPMLPIGIVSQAAQRLIDAHGMGAPIPTQQLAMQMASQSGIGQAQMPSGMAVQLPGVHHSRYFQDRANSIAEHNAIMGEHNAVAAYRNAEAERQRQEFLNRSALGAAINHASMEQHENPYDPSGPKPMGSLSAKDSSAIRARWVQRMMQQGYGEHDAQDAYDRAYHQAVTQRNDKYLSDAQKIAAMKDKTATANRPRIVEESDPETGLKRTYAIRYDGDGNPYKTLIPEPPNTSTVPKSNPPAVTKEPTATNPQTGERMVLRNGQWQKLQ